MQKSLHFAQCQIKYNCETCALGLYDINDIKTLNWIKQDSSHTFMLVDWIFMPLSDYQM